MNIKTSTEKWKYISSLDDWAKVVDNAEPMTSKTVLGNTVFADCSASQVKTTLSIDETVTPAASQACIIEANGVKPTAIGPCYVKATVDNANVSATGVRRFSTPATVWMNYSFTSVSATTTTTTTTSTPSVTILKLTTSKSATAKSIATYAKLAVLSTSKVSLKVVSSYAKYCKVFGTTLKGLKAGSCKVTVTVTPKKGNAASKTVTLKVTK